MKLFDFYDTLVTRLVADPADIFSLIGIRLDIPQFREIRIAAERQARKKHNGEVSFAQIYENIDLPDALRDDAAQLELKLEQALISLVAENAARFNDGDVIVSDMYHDEAFFNSILKALMPDKQVARILVSGAIGVSKARGGLWKHVSDQFPEHDGHIGDNRWADVKQAKRHGFRAFHYRSAELNRYEAELKASGLDGSLIAGASRATRLGMVNAGHNEQDIGTIELFSSVFGPLLLAFTNWIIERCETERIGRVYFMSRDGQLPFRACSALVESRGLDLRCEYVYGSRHALHLPGVTSVEAAQSWLLENTPVLTLRQIAGRAGISVDVIISAAAGHLNADLDRNIPADDRPRLVAVIREPRFREALSQASAAAFESAKAYYSSVGLDDPEPCALVDIGWNGRLQGSLRGLLNKGNIGPALLLGLYLCLSRKPKGDPRDELVGFLDNPLPGSAPGSFYDRFREVLEAAFSADHPTTVGFRQSEDGPEPTFGLPYDDDIARRIGLQHACIASFIKNICLLEQAGMRQVSPPLDPIVQNLRRFLLYPSKRDSMALVNFHFASGQLEDSQSTVARKVRLHDVLFRRHRLGFWKEGSMRASGFQAILKARNVLRGLH